jgi:hypothetical protein
VRNGKRKKDVVSTNKNSLFHPTGKKFKVSILRTNKKRKFLLTNIAKHFAPTKNERYLA